MCIRDSRYGGGHVIQNLVEGKEMHFRATAYGTDCYPLKKFEKNITLHDLRDAFLFSPRNAYQNYNVGTNLSLIHISILFQQLVILLVECIFSIPISYV